MIDFFGHNRQVRSSAQLSSSEYARLSVGGNVDLCQSVQAEYGQEIRPIFQVGDPNIYFVTGHAQGSVSFGRLVGRNGFFANLRGTQCGRISPVAINSSGGGTCYGGGGSLTFDGGIIERVNLQMTAGTVEITEGATIRVASMS